MNLVPVLASILAVAVLDEPFAVYHAIALALVIAGILLAQRSPASLRRSQPHSTPSRGLEREAVRRAREDQPRR
jgi:hypothetical protein